MSKVARGICCFCFALLLSVSVLPQPLPVPAPTTVITIVCMFSCKYLYLLLELLLAPALPLLLPQDGRAQLLHRLLQVRLARLELPLYPLCLTPQLLLDFELGLLGRCAHEPADRSEQEEGHGERQRIPSSAFSSLPEVARFSSASSRHAFSSAACDSANCLCAVSKYKQIYDDKQKKKLQWWKDLQSFNSAGLLLEPLDAAVANGPHVVYRLCGDAVRTPYGRK